MLYEINKTAAAEVFPIFGTEALLEVRRDIASQALSDGSKQPITISCGDKQLASLLASTMRRMVSHGPERFIIKQKGSEVYACSADVAQKIVRDMLGTGDRE